MKQSLLILIITLLWACSDNDSKNTSDQADSNVIDSISMTDDLIIFDSIGPCDDLLQFVAELEKLNWISDTSRLNKVNIYSELDRETIKYFNDRPF